MDLTRTSAKDLHRNASTLLRRVRRGERFIIEWYEEDSALLLPIGDLERLEGNVSQGNPPITYAQIDEERREAFKRETLARIKALVGVDKIEALRLLTELQAELLANGGQP